MKLPYECIITSQHIHIEQAIPFISDHAHGAICHFTGVVRDHNEGKRVTGIDYEIAEPLATHTLKKISQEALTRFPQLKVYVVHFEGYLHVGEISMLVSTSSPHRKECYEANRFIVEAIKHRCPIWKKEYYTDNTMNWVKGCKIEYEHC